MSKVLSAKIDSRLIILLLIIANALDATTTWWGIGSGWMYEANPIMSRLISAGWVYFFIFKLGFAVLGGFILCRVRMKDAAFVLSVLLLGCAIWNGYHMLTL